MADKTVQQNKKQLVKASARNLRISPRKLRLVTNLVKNMRVNDALVQLQFTNKKGAGMVAKLLQSAAANAENNFSLNRDGLYIQSITCNMGPVLMRSFPRARGSAFIIRRKMAHVNVVLEERGVKAKATAQKPVAKVKKADKPVQTVEGSVGLPVEKAEKMHTDLKAKEEHYENLADAVEQKSSNDKDLKK